MHVRPSGPRPDGCARSSVYQQPLVERDVVLPNGEYVLEGGGVTQVYPAGLGTGLLWLSHRSARRGSKWRDGMSIESVAPCVVKEARHTIARLRLPGRDEP